MRCDDRAPMDNGTWLLGPPRNHTRFGEVARFREGLYRLTEGTYAWMVPNGSWGETNLGLIDCGSTSVLIDTCWGNQLFKHLPIHVRRCA
jgi:cyclase